MKKYLFLIPLFLFANFAFASTPLVSYVNNSETGTVINNSPVTVTLNYNYYGGNVTVDIPSGSSLDLNTLSSIPMNSTAFFFYSPSNDRYLYGTFSYNRLTDVLTQTCEDYNVCIVPVDLNTINLESFNGQLDKGVDTAISMVTQFGLKGIYLALAVITAGLVIFFVYWGFHKGKKALSGK